MWWFDIECGIQLLIWYQGGRYLLEVFVKRKGSVDLQYPWVGSVWVGVLGFGFE